ncbi:MAG: hypothetical protein Q8916_06890 [Bacteroidota bacterium]|nr:hypothetical protein [Bacteroidota bacterium]MDP4237097.1 hypothetical protein [Bacteroidota bacterium]
MSIYFNFQEDFKPIGSAILPGGTIIPDGYVSAVFEGFTRRCNEIGESLEYAALRCFKMENGNIVGKGVAAYWDMENGEIRMEWNSLWENERWLQLKTRYAVSYLTDAEKEEITQEMKELAGTSDLDSVDLELRISRHYWR